MVDEGVDLFRLLAAGLHLEKRERKSEGKGPAVFTAISLSGRNSICHSSSSLAIKAKARGVVCRDCGVHGRAGLSELDSQCRAEGFLEKNKGLQVHTVLLFALNKRGANSPNPMATLSLEPPPFSYSKSSL